MRLRGRRRVNRALGFFIEKEAVGEGTLLVKLATTCVDLSSSHDMIDGLL